MGRQLYFIRMSLNGVEDSGTDMRTLKRSEILAAVSCLKCGKHLPDFVRWWPETIE
jgi:hypothetical protein